MKEMRILGPPGTGKSTYLATTAIPQAVDKYGPEKVVVTSFTRTAAKEISSKKSIKTGKQINLPDEHVGTLHKFCFHMFSQPTFAHTKIAMWNETHPHYEISAGAANLDDMTTKKDGQSDGDILLGKLDILRAKCTPVDQWPNEVKNFEKEWSKFKNSLDIMDYTDLIEKAQAELPFAPGHPEIIFVDEAQDFTPLQLKLVRSWALQAEWLVLVGDDDQTVYDFTGATPEAFITPPIEDKYKKVLGQSYRVPRAVHKKAMEIISRVSLREPKEYKPKDIDGEVVYSKETYKSLYCTIDDIQENTNNGKSVMFLTTCGYMLNYLISQLRQFGVPFSNKYRLQDPRWNPLSRGENGKILSMDLIENFNAHGEDGNYWTVKQFVTWAKFLRVGDHGLIRKQGKAGIKALTSAIEQGAEGLHTTRNVLSQILSPESLQPALDRDTKWLREALLATRQKSIEYPMRVFDEKGLEGLLSEPDRCTVGTIHSVKGGEADVVYLCPDISFNATKQIDRIGDKDNLLRLFYVGATRAKEKLVILNPATRNFIDL